jgi:Fur family ferric uptake transcriptional regulator
MTGTTRTVSRVTTGDLDEILDQIRDRGGRVTPSVRRVLEIILDSSVHHFVASDLVDTVREVEPSAYESTVHRILDRLVSYGVLERIQLGTGSPSYHFAANQHEHLFCVVCGKVYEVPKSLLDDLAHQLVRDHDFVLRIGSSPLHGTCRDCHLDE